MLSQALLQLSQEKVNSLGATQLVNRQIASHLQCRSSQTVHQSQPKRSELLDLFLVDRLLLGLHESDPEGILRQLGRLA